MNTPGSMESPVTQEALELLLPKLEAWVKLRRAHIDAGRDGNNIPLETIGFHSSDFDARISGIAGFIVGITSKGSMW